LIVYTKRAETFGFRPFVFSPHHSELFMRKSSSECLARKGSKFPAGNYAVFFDEKLKKKTKF
jgi:hypothetical protein